MTVIAFPRAAVPPASPARTPCLVFETWAERRRYRFMLRNDLLLQPDSVLEDAGITRAEAICEAKKPFWRA